MPVKLNLKHQPICKVGGSHNIYSPESARINLVIKKPKYFFVQPAFLFCQNKESH